MFSFAERNASIQKLQQTKRTFPNNGRQTEQSGSHCQQAEEIAMEFESVNTLKKSVEEISDSNFDAQHRPKLAQELESKKISILDNLE